MKKEIKFSLVFRDMWQSAGKYVPRVDQLVKVAPAIVEMGCFARVETNGGGFEQVNLLFGENPNKAVRAWTKPFHEAGIQTHMLDRALNGLRMSPVPADVRKLFYKVKKVQGTDITRTFCGLNDTRNIIPSIAYAKKNDQKIKEKYKKKSSRSKNKQYLQYITFTTKLINKLNTI